MGEAVAGVAETLLTLLLRNSTLLHEAGRRHLPHIQPSVLVFVDRAGLTARNPAGSPARDGTACPACHTDLARR